jgi:hypothetical protein
MTIKGVTMMKTKAQVRDELKSKVTSINEQLTIAMAQSLHREGYDFLYEDGTMTGFEKRVV